MMDSVHWSFSPLQFEIVLQKLSVFGNSVFLGVSFLPSLFGNSSYNDELNPSEAHIEAAIVAAESHTVLDYKRFILIMFDLHK